MQSLLKFCLTGFPAIVAVIVTVYLL